MENRLLRLRINIPPPFATTTKTGRPHYVEQFFTVHCLKWDFCPPISSLTPVLPPLQLVSPLTALLPTPTLPIVLNIYTSLSPTLLPLCLLVTPRLSLLHSHSRALQVSMLTSSSSLLVSTYPCFSSRITPVSPPTAGTGPLSPCLQLLEIPRLCPFLFHPPATLRAKSISFCHPFATASAILGEPVGSLIVFHF